MASRIIKYDSFKRGDTPVFGFTFTAPSLTFNWTTILIDAAMTSNTAPNDNSGAGLLRQNQTLTVDAANNAYFYLQPSVSESKALTPGATYSIEVQLKDTTNTNVATPLTGQVTILQDYII